MAEKLINELLLKNTAQSLPISICLESLTWGKSLVGLPTFTKREVDLHIQKCGKKKVIKKTSTRG